METEWDATPILLLDAEFSDLEELCAAVRSWNLDLRPLSSRAGTGKVARIIQQRRGSLEIGYARFAASIDQRGAPPERSLTFGVPEQGMRRLWWRGQDLDAGTVLVFPIGSELRSLSGPDFEIHTISAGEETIARICDRFGLPLKPGSPGPETFRPPPRLLQMLRLRLRRLRDRAGSIDNSEADRLLESLVLAWREPADSRRGYRPPMRVRERAIRKCLEWIEQADWTELSPGVLCEIGGVGERTLQYAFRERFGLSPAAFLKARRLGAVRSRLLQAEVADLRVGEVSASFGFWHVGQFAADYRRAFGERPSETLNRLPRD